MEKKPVFIFLGVAILVVAIGIAIIFFTSKNSNKSAGTDSGSSSDTNTSTGSQSDKSQEWIIGLAKSLKEKGAVMYGAYWCPHCKAEKARFGTSFQYVP